VANDEFAYLLDLHLFLGRPFNPLHTQTSSQDDDFPDGIIGCIPEVLLDEEHSELRVWHETDNDLVSGIRCMYSMAGQSSDNY
jgi:ATP-dependent RNA helicase DDX54/DBP10